MSVLWEPSRHIIDEAVLTPDGQAIAFVRQAVRYPLRRQLLARLQEDGYWWEHPAERHVPAGASLASAVPEIPVK